jgi:hypothetical protein
VARQATIFSNRGIATMRLGRRFHATSTGKEKEEIKHERSLLMRAINYALAPRPISSSNS